MNNLPAQFGEIENRAMDALKEVLHRGDYINGREVNLFSYELAQYTGVKFVQPCANGTDALFLALKALDIGIGDEVIVPDFGYVSAVEAVVLVGATPVFVDVEHNTYNIDPAEIELAVGEKVKAIVVIHLFGLCCNMNKIMKIAKTYDIKVIEDCAQSFGAKLGTKMACSFGDIACTSFFPTKMLGGFGDGGALLTNNEELYERLRRLCQHGQVEKYNHVEVGVNSRLDTIQAALLRIRLSLLDEYIERRRAVAEVYSSGFLACLKRYNIAYPRSKKAYFHVYNQYSIRVNPIYRDRLRKFLFSNQIMTMIYYPLPLHRQKAYNKLGRKVGDLQVSADICKEIISLPINPSMNISDAEGVASMVCEFIRREN